MDAKTRWNAEDDSIRVNSCSYAVKDSSTMKIPVTIVTGFLGSGKTTLICGLLKKIPDRRLAVLINEFGEVSVDGTLLRAAGKEHGAEIHDLPNGCICCTIKDDFLPVMKQLQRRKTRNRPCPDRDLRVGVANAGDEGIGMA